MGSYAYLTFGTLKAELLARLQDTSAQFTSNTEAGIYLTEALRVLNAQTFQWNADFLFDFDPGDTWKSLNVAGSPRQRTVTDTDLYNQMEAMLMEPMSGGTWTGTSQFNIGLLSAALQYRRDELLLQSAANPINLLQNSPVLSTRTSLPDSMLDLFRVRWIAVDSSMPYVLGREDVNTTNAFGPLLSIQPGAPESWVITASPPLTFDVSCPPNQPGTWDMLTSMAGATLVPPASTAVGLPDDWTWVALYGALADVLANSPEGRDSARAKYCLQRYQQGRKAMLELPWLIEATVADIAVDTPSYKEIDAWMQDWEQRQPVDDPQIVVGGIDLVALAPFATTGTVSSVLTVIGNAPIPASDSADVQLSRDGVDAVLNYAQHVASFKMGSGDFAETMPLLEQFEGYCRKKNAQYAALGIFRPQMLLEGNRADEVDPRFEREKMNFDRDKNGKRLSLGGINTVNPPDQMPAGRFPYLQNVRRYQERVTGRATQSAPVVTLDSSPVAIARLNDTTPAGPVGGFTLIAASSGGRVYAGASAVATGLSGNPPSLIPFRPNTSVQPWMYIGDSAPFPNVTVDSSFSCAGMIKVRSDGLSRKMGIEEPQDAPTVTFPGGGTGPSQIFYNYTYYASETGAESNPSPVSIPGTNSQSNPSATENAATGSTINPNITVNASQYEGNSNQIRTKGGVAPGTITDFIVARGFGPSLAIPDNVTIDGIATDLNWIGQNSGTGVLSAVSLYYLGGPIGNPKFPATQNQSFSTDTILGGNNDTWGATLTPAIVNDASFGFGVQITTQSSGGSDRSFVNFMKLIAYLLDPGCRSYRVTFARPAGG